MYLKRTRRLPEANIQAEFYMACKNNNLNCLLEYKTKGARFDAVIYTDNEKVTHIIEVKSYIYPDQKNSITKQLEKYRTYGPKVILLDDINKIPSIIEEIIKDNNSVCN